MSVALLQSIGPLTSSIIAFAVVCEEAVTTPWN
jgi:hypothetical protein